MKRITDKHYFDFYLHTIEIYVKCPTCQGLGIIKTGKEFSEFTCTSCGRKDTKDIRAYTFNIKNICVKCNQYYRIEIEDSDKTHFQALHTECPHCGAVMSGKVNKLLEPVFYSREIHDAKDPFFGYALWFLSTFKEKSVWALNREHLSYLIEYLNADLREKPVGFMNSKTQSDHLPTFMKTHKNRDRILKLLKEMQKKLA